MVITADTSCERFRHVSASAAQVAAMKADWGLWETYAVQIAQHNVEYDKHCLAPAKGN